MKRLTALLLLCLALALTGACGSGNDGYPEGGEDALEAEQAANADENFTESEADANGKAGVAYDGIDEITGGTYTYVFHSITLDPACPSGDPSAVPQEGHFVMLEATMTTGYVNPDSPWVEFDHVSLTDPSGKLDKTPSTYESWLCAGDDGFPTGGIRDGQSVDFVVVLDTSHTSGIITYQGRQFDF